MNLKSLAKRSILGSSLPNEYVCLSATLRDGLRVILNKDLDERDVTEIQMLLGYKPLLVGLPFQDEEMVLWAARKSLLRLSFRSPSMGNKEIAWLELKKAGSWRMGNTTLYIYEGQRGGHEFMSQGYRLIDIIYELLRSRKAGNVSLSRKLYTQVRTAYAVPRKISLISVGTEGKYNIFPTDLHGSVGKDFYAGSLRIGSMATGQVEAYKNILISDMNVSAYREPYSLGKNHMGGLRPLDDFQTSGLSDRFQLPVPLNAVAYKELLWKNSWESGIHRVHFYEVVGEKILDGRASRLCHIHRHYAQWRINNRLEAEYFFR